ncbi:MAG: 50S ribosomal protein L4, partial [Nitrospinales bacterium]
MKKINIYSPVSKTVSTLNLPKDFDEPLNEKLLAQAIHVYRFLSHQGKSKTLTRGEVARTTQKWYRQKGTGRARHGARSAPIFVGGSKAHGPKDLKKNITLPKKMRIKALKNVLSQI